MNSKDRPQFEMQIDIAAPRDAVFRALTSAQELVRWFAVDAEIAPEVGGEVVWKWGEHHTWPQRIEICEPGVRLRTRYDSAVADGVNGKKPLFIDFLLEGEGGMTTLRLVHSGFGPEAEFDQEYEGISGGWPIELRSLRLYLENHAGKDRQLAWSTTAVSVDADEAWRLLTGDAGFACGTAMDQKREGDPFRVQTAAGDLFEGTTLVCKKREFAGMVENRGNGFVRFSIENIAGRTSIWLWLATYGQPPGDTDKVQSNFQTMLERVFPVAASAGGA